MFSPSKLSWQCSRVEDTAQNHTRMERLQSTWSLSTSFSSVGAADMVALDNTMCIPQPAEALRGLPEDTLWAL